MYCYSRKMFIINGNETFGMVKQKYNNRETLNFIDLENFYR